MNEMGGTRGVLVGNLKRRLESVKLARTSLSEGQLEGTATLVGVIKGLSSVLDVFVSVGAFQVDDENNANGLPASLWPLGAGTIQIIPQTNFPDRPKMQFRPVFQDPTNLLNVNAPLPQALPYSYNFPGECDEAIIEVVLNMGAWQLTGLGGVQITLQVMVEYTGDWWDAQAIELALGQVQLTPPGGNIVMAAQVG